MSIIFTQGLEIVNLVELMRLGREVVVMSFKKSARALLFGVVLLDAFTERGLTVDISSLFSFEFVGREVIICLEPTGIKSTVQVVVNIFASHIMDCSNMSLGLTVVHQLIVHELLDSGRYVLVEVIGFRMELNPLVRLLFILLFLQLFLLSHWFRRSLFNPFAVVLTLFHQLIQQFVLISLSGGFVELVFQ